MIYILCEVEPNHPGCEEQERALAESFDQAGMPNTLLTKSFCDPIFVERYETQTNIIHPYRADYCDRIFELLSRGVLKGDMIILTREWHHQVFRGMLSRGEFHGVPVIEAYCARTHSYPKPAGAR